MAQIRSLINHQYHYNHYFLLSYVTFECLLHFKVIISCSLFRRSKLEFSYSIDILTAANVSIDIACTVPRVTPPEPITNIKKNPFSTPLGHR